MRLINCRYLFSPRRLRYFILVLIFLVVFLNLHMRYMNQKPITIAQSNLTRPWRFINGILYTSLKTTSSCPTKLLFLILVSSNVGHFDRRNLIRKTWGPDYALKVRWRTVFLLSMNDNKEEMKRLGVEESLYGDIVRSGYKEDFFNMAFKVAMGFEWAIKYCQFDYLLKADDDTFVNTHGLLKYFTDKNTPSRGLYSGNPMIGSPVLRKGRYKVEYDRGEERDDQLNKTVFAPYCSGGGFVMSVDVVKLILDRFDIQHPLNIDDAYIGELAERANVELLVNSKNYLMYANSCEYSVQAYVQHPAKTKCLEKLYEQHMRYLATGELPKTTRPPTKPPTQPTKPTIAAQTPRIATQHPKIAKKQQKIAKQQQKIVSQHQNSHPGTENTATIYSKIATQLQKIATQPTRIPISEQKHQLNKTPSGKPSTI